MKEAMQERSRKGNAMMKPVKEAELQYMPLTDKKYSQMYATFLTKSTQLLEMTRMMKPFVDGFQGEEVDFMSIGAGAGFFEDDLIRNQGLNVKYFLGIEPSAAHRAALERIVSAWQSIDSSIDARYYNELYVTEHRFDLILMSHSIYYMQNPVNAIVNAKSLLKPQGKLILFLDTGFGDSDLYRRMAQRVAFHPLSENAITSHSISVALNKSNIKHELKEGPGKLDVTDFIVKSNCPTANDVITLLLHTDFDAISQIAKEDIYRMVKEKVEADERGKYYLSQPIGMIVVNNG